MKLDIVDVESEHFDSNSEGMDSNEWVMERCFPHLPPQKKTGTQPHRMRFVPAI